VKGIVSRPHTTRLSILRALIVLAITACAVVAVAPAVGASPSHASTVRPYYVECTTTFWQTAQSVQSNTSPPWGMTVYEQVLKDSRDFSFCSQIRTEVVFAQPSGYCDTFYANVVDFNHVSHGQNYVYSCANGGNAYSLPWSGNCAYSKGWDYLGYDLAATIGGCF